MRAFALFFPLFFLSASPSLLGQVNTEPLSYWQQDQKGQKNAQIRLDIFDFSDRHLLKPLEINTESEEFSPTFFKNGLLFVSDRSVGRIWKTVSANKHKSFFDLYFWDLEDQQNHSKVIEFHFNRGSHYHHGPATFCAQTNEVFLTIDQMAKFNNRKHRSDNHWIYSAKVTAEGKWVDLVPLPFNKEEFSCAYPSVSADGSTLYFASDMPHPKALGGMDLYKVKRDANGHWSKPEHLGSQINTKSDEVYPFIHQDGTLYFSSDGHSGLGGLDIFEAPINKAGKFEKVYNLGSPINSNKDDYGLILRENKREGYLTSHRKGGQGASDLYLLNVLQISPSRRLSDQSEKAYPLFSIPVNGYAFEKGTNYPIQKAVVRIRNEITGEISTLKTDENGFFSTQLLNDGKYQINCSALGFHSAPDTLINTFGYADKTPIIFDKKLVPHQIDLRIVGRVINKENNMPVPHALARLKDVHTGQVTKMLTDDQGNYSFQLNQGRVYQIFAHADFFDNSPVYTLSMVNKTHAEQLKFDLPLGSLRNKGIATICHFVDYQDNNLPEDVPVRLIDWATREVLEQRVTNEQGQVFFALDSTKKYIIEVLSDSFVQESYLKIDGKSLVGKNNAVIKDKMTSPKVALTNPFNEDLLVGEVKLFAPKVYYYSNEVEMTPHVAAQLDRVVEFLKKHEHLKIGISSYTDVKGSAKLNKYNSYKRAEAAMVYLVTHGIKEDRIIFTNGRGCENLVNHCVQGVNCSEEEHQKNRRTEFIILD